MTPQFKPLPFDSELHDDLFKLFILASNDRLYPIEMNDIKFLMNFNVKPFVHQYEDRSLADEEFEAQICTRVIGNPLLNHVRKIKYRYMEDA